MRPLVLWPALLLTMLHGAAQAQPPALRLDRIGDAPTARQQEFFPLPGLDKAHDGRCGNVAGMAAASDGSVVFSEATTGDCASPKGVLGGRMWLMNGGSAPASLFREPTNMASGLAIDANNHLVTAERGLHGGGRVSVTDLATGEYRVVAYLDRQRDLSGPEDVAVDGTGRIYFSDRGDGLFRLDPPAKDRYGAWPVTRIVSAAAAIKGVELSPDGRTLYAASCQTRDPALLAYPLDAAGKPGAPRRLLELGKARCVNGMTVDVEGNVYLALSGTRWGPSLVVLTPRGDYAARFEMPDDMTPVGLAFGRAAHAKTLYIATAEGGKVYRLTVGKAGELTPPPKDEKSAALSDRQE